MVIAALATAAIIFITVIYYSRPKAKFINVQASEPKKEFIKARKVLTLVSEPAEQD